MSKIGRPTKYDPDMDFGKLADKYLESCGREQTKMPKLSEFCRDYIGVNEDTVLKWIKDESKKDLIGAVKKVKEVQKEQLMDDGMYGGKEVNSGMAIFLLKANHGLKEEQVVTHKGADITLDIKQNEVHETK